MGKATHVMIQSQVCHKTNHEQYIIITAKVVTTLAFSGIDSQSKSRTYTILNNLSQVVCSHVRLSQTGKIGSGLNPVSTVREKVW